MKPAFRFVPWAMVAAGLIALGPAAVPGLTKKPDPFKDGSCLRCHHQMDTGKDDGVIMGSWVNRSKKAKTLTVRIGPRMQIVKFTPTTKVENAPSLAKLGKGLAVRILFTRQGADLVATKVVAKPEIKVPQKMLIGAKDLAALVAQKKVAALVDSRPPFLFEAGTIPGAINIPFPAMEKMKGKLPQDKNALVVFFCQGFR